MSTNQKDLEDIKNFFNSYSKGFSSIYTEDDKSRSIFDKLMDKLFRQGVYKRYERSLEATQKDSIKTVLDVGCGPGTILLHSFIKAKKLRHLILLRIWLI